jgi:hypothetical protein
MAFLPRIPVFPAAAAFACLWLTGCLKPDQAALTSSSASARSVPDCASCHAYPLRDVNHYYHLMGINPISHIGADFKLNGPITCLDCHFGSVAEFSYPFPETTWVDKDGFELPFKSGPTDTIARITAHMRHHPVPADLQGAPLTGESVDTLIARATRIGEVVAWLTGKQHMNSQVDVSFPPNDLVGSLNVAQPYRPRDLSCSAIACHTAPEVSYRWASKALGTSTCPTYSGTDTACGENPR